MYLNGYIFLDKIKGKTSFEIILKIKHQHNINKISYVGTLDPLGSGLLIILLGKYTKFNQYINGLQKRYMAYVKINERKTTYDKEGSISLIQIIKNINYFKMKNEISKFTSHQFQTPPIFSAVKTQGYRIYQWAQKGLFNIKIPTKYICLYKLKLLKFNLNFAIFLSYCSKGTYIRTLINDIGENLSTSAFNIQLKRIGIFNFTVKLSDQKKYFNKIKRKNIIKRHINVFRPIRISQISIQTLEKINQGKGFFIHGFIKNATRYQLQLSTIHQKQSFNKLQIIILK